MLTINSDTASCALSFLFYFLARDRSLRERLRQELAAAVQKSGEFDHADIQNNELLNAFINETLRVYPPASSMGGRITPPEGLMVDDVWIPGGTEVDTPVIIYHRSESGITRHGAAPERH
jgi:cytochrome P450 family 628